ncbi:hypothetical protein N9D02_09240 [Emcibacteraceae bacterium]|nr:hypothetical protein [Emcibacteraceae bacterium]
MSENLTIIANNGLEILEQKGLKALNETLLNSIEYDLKPQRQNNKELQKSILIIAGLLIENWEDVLRIESPRDVQTECNKIKDDLENIRNLIDTYRHEQKSFRLLLAAYHKIRIKNENESEMKSFERGILINNEMSNLFLKFDYFSKKIQALFSTVATDMEDMKSTFRRNPKEGTFLAISSLAIIYKEYTGLQPTYTNPTETSTNNSRGKFFEFVISVIGPVYSVIGKMKNKPFPEEAIGKLTYQVVKDYKDNPDNFRLYY